MGPGVSVLPTQPRRVLKPSRGAGSLAVLQPAVGGLQSEDTAQQDSICAGVAISTVQWPQSDTGLVSEAVLPWEEPGR